MLTRLLSFWTVSGFLEPLGNTESLPFQFRRTASKQLPVYSAMKNGLTRRVTVVRGYEGSSEVRFVTEKFHDMLHFGIYIYLTMISSIFEFTPPGAR
jgi:hypothetical protein